jgi:precorrin-6A/cobalt-precorrin-6A reductase
VLQTLSLLTVREKLLAMPAKILILGGTTEAREIASALMSEGHDVTYSLAGVTSSPTIPKGRLRVGGFGGAEGLQHYLKLEKIEVVIDATHPYAATISAHAYAAVQNTTVQLFRFERPAWQAVLGDRWILVQSLAEAAMRLPASAKVFITTGRKELSGFLMRHDVSGVIRSVEPVAEELPPAWRVILDRPPHGLEAELRLFQQERFSHIIAKNAGSASTKAKLDAARALQLPVIMIGRPLKPFCETFANVPAIVLRLGTVGFSG